MSTWRMGKQLCLSESDRHAIVIATNILGVAHHFRTAFAMRVPQQLDTIIQLVDASDSLPNWKQLGF
jgi:hypothetical protein